jgi:hypothetical protein
MIRNALGVLLMIGAVCVMVRGHYTEGLLMLIFNEVISINQHLQERE